MNYLSEPGVYVRRRLGVKRRADPQIIGGMITSTINVLLLVPVFFVMMKTRALRQVKHNGAD